LIKDIQVAPAGLKGLGVFAKRKFIKGDFIFKRRHGRVVKNAEIPTLSQEEQIHLCELDWDTSAVLYPPGCYLNHSCDPNAMRKGTKVFAWKNIDAGEEITIDYRLNAFSGEICDCQCSSDNCPGYFTLSFFALSEATQREYLPFAPKFIQDEYQRRR
jgi:hypothetical protein